MNQREINEQQKAAVIGHPISQSLSPLIHQYWFDAYHINGKYTAIDVDTPQLEKQVNTFKSNGFQGFNVTVPHKVAILPFLDKLAPLARQMGAVNTVKINPDGTTAGFNTDGIGFIKHLNYTAPDWAKHRPALVLGAGGAARAACLALLGADVPMIMLSNRTREKAEIIARDIGRGRMMVIDWSDRSDAVAGAGLVVNTTVLGMTGQLPLSLDLSCAMKDTTVYDIVFKPLETELLKSAHQHGLKTVDGLGMLVHQAAAAFKIWFGVDVSFDTVLQQKLHEALL